MSRPSGDCYCAPTPKPYIIHAVTQGHRTPSLPGVTFCGEVRSTVDRREDGVPCLKCFKAALVALAEATR